ncbi:unnamed protein product [Protopolystoma xenopodis]|uniref:Uncharacterized protein n=1 Tax=Protopolystoma xenopodis TaxID=117903 RepID=A0A3S5AVT3_9PLAT|nr:unnamed protein product [Protopolystoma xenopodis]
MLAIRLGKYHVNGPTLEMILHTIDFGLGAQNIFSFRDSCGAFLTTMGPGTLKSRKGTIGAQTAGKEDLFLVERASVQVAIMAHNNKFASTKQGAQNIFSFRDSCGAFLTTMGPGTLKSRKGTIGAQTAGKEDLFLVERASVQPTSPVPGGGPNYAEWTRPIVSAAETVVAAFTLQLQLVSSFQAGQHVDEAGRWCSCRTMARRLHLIWQHVWS